MLLRLVFKFKIVSIVSITKGKLHSLPNGQGSLHKLWSSETGKRSHRRISRMGDCQLSSYGISVLVHLKYHPIISILNYVTWVDQIHDIPTQISSDI